MYSGAGAGEISLSFLEKARPTASRIVFFFFSAFPNSISNIIKLTIANTILCSELENEGPYNVPTFNAGLVVDSSVVFLLVVAV
jgi:hypothetical protein